MKKLLFVAVLAGFFVTDVSARSFNANWSGGRPRIGAKAGIMPNRIDIRQADKSGTHVLSGESQVGWQVGVAARIGVILQFQPELNLNMSRYGLRAKDSDGNLSKADVAVNSLEMPVLMGINFFLFRVQMGPTFNLMTSTHVSKNRGEKLYVDAMRPGASFTLGLGFNIWKFNLDARYYRNLKKVKQDIQIGNGEELRYKTYLNRNWMFSLGYFF